MSSVASQVVDYISKTADVIAVLGLVGTAWGMVASLLLWRSRRRRHRFTKVYFPKHSADFYDYYVSLIAKARKEIRITSDGFNLCNPGSRAAAERMGDAQTKAIERGATVLRYQMLQTMHINWLAEIVRMKRLHGPSYRTLVNPAYEQSGNFAVIDPGTRHAVVEFMLPDPGGLSQSTTARDFGFIHGHQAKADETKAFFDRLEQHELTFEIDEASYEAVARRLFEERVARHFSRDSEFHLFDQEILTAQKRVGKRRVCFEDVRFQGWAEETSAARPSP